MKYSRREFVKTSAFAGLAVTGYLTGAMPVGSAKISNAQDMGDFSFAYISDSHIIVKPDYNKKEHRFVTALKKAVDDVNAISPQPDFVFFGGDLAQLGLPEELETGKEILSSLKIKPKMMVGEHDWYYDMGKKWRDLFGKDTYSFDHKGVHFIVLNSVIVEDYWTKPAMTPMERMKAMAQLDNPNGRPFTVGKEQRDWLQTNLSSVSKKTPVVVFSHSPLYKYYKSWNFWTDDAEEIQEILSPFETVTVIHGHTHQVLTNRLKSISFHGLLSTAWPWPYAPSGLPQYTKQMFRADPFNQFDGCGWGTVKISKGGTADKRYMLWDRTPMEVTYADLESGIIPDQPDAPDSGPSY